MYSFFNHCLLMIVSFVFLFAISRFVPKASKSSFHLCRGNTNNIK